MIGYVQADKAAVWINRIHAALTDSPDRHGFQSARGFSEVRMSEFPTPIRLSHHRRNASRPSIAIYHTLLNFVE
jgi:hypothetical protein